MIPAQWTEANNTLYRTFEVEDFDIAFDFADEIREIANELEHHPEIRITYDAVTVITTTHDAGNTITEKDIELAEMINELYESEEEFEEEDFADEEDGDMFTDDEIDDEDGDSDESDDRQL